MLGKMISALRNLLATGATGRRWTPGASDLAYATDLPIAVCDAALRFLGDDLAPFVLAHRRAEILDLIGDTLTGSELEIALAEVFFEDPAPGCEVKPHRGFNLPDFYDMRGTPRWVVYINGRRFGAVFRERADAARVSWHLYRQAMESEASDVGIFAEYKRAMADASKTVGPHVPEPWPDPPPRK